MKSCHKSGSVIVAVVLVANILRSVFEEIILVAVLATNIETDFVENKGRGDPSGSQVIPDIRGGPWRDRNGSSGGGGSNKQIRIGLRRGRCRGGGNKHFRIGLRSGRGVGSWSRGESLSSSQTFPDVRGGIGAEVRALSLQESGGGSGYPKFGLLACRKAAGSP